ncbi:MAG TPA: hypothetical protein VMS38_28960, partial [Pseudorhodoferax sp.]|nr:hypothetical protein [Pseudorhodoferax sp.]
MPEAEEVTGLPPLATWRGQGIERSVVSDAALVGDIVAPHHVPPRGVGFDISRFQVWNKTGYVFKGKPYQSLGWMNQYTFHQQDS